MSLDNFIAIGNDELKGSIKEGDVIYSEKLNRKGIVKFGTDENGEKTDMLVFIKYGDVSYLVGVSGQLINDWVVIHD